MSSAQTPQAKSEEESYSYPEIYKGADPQFTITLADRFAGAYPQSEFLALVYGHQTLAYQQTNNYAGVIRASEKALALRPRNIKYVLPSR